MYVRMRLMCAEGLHFSAFHYTRTIYHDSFGVCMFWSRLVVMSGNYMYMAIYMYVPIVSMA